MSSMPVGARVYWWIVTCLGIGSLALSQAPYFPNRPHSSWELVSFSVLALLFGGQKLSLTGLRRDEHAMSMTIGFALTFAALIRLGPSSTVPISMLCSVSTCLFPSRYKAHQFIFNVSLSAIEALAGAVVFLALNRWTLILEPTQTFAAVAGSSAVFFAVNTFGVAEMISLYTKQTVLPIWKEHFVWTAPGYLASASVGALAMILFHGSSAALFLFVLPIAYVVYKFLAIHLASIHEQKQHIEDLKAKQVELEDLYLATIESLALAIDAKDKYTHQHIVRVQRYAVAIARAMGMEGVELQGVKTGALLHDIGKLGIPEYVLSKPGALTTEEYDQVKLHPEIGASILGPVVFPWPVMPSVKYHHERWDGSGYPDGLAAEEIPITARIMAVADVYDAVTSTRAYRDARTHEQALAIIRNGANKDFDPVVVEAFLRVIDDVVTEMAAEGTGPLFQEQLAKAIQTLEPSLESEPLDLVLAIHADRALLAERRIGMDRQAGPLVATSAKEGQSSDQFKPPAHRRANDGALAPEEVPPSAAATTLRRKPR